MRALAVDPEAGAAGVPRPVLQARRGRPGTATGGRDRLRHHDRPRATRRAAHRQGQGGRHPYRGRPPGLRAVVLDAPPTGRIGRFLNVTTETARLAKVGPIKTQSDGVAALLRSPMTAVHLVTLLEEMPVQETADALAELRRLGLPVGRSSSTPPGRLCSRRPARPRRRSCAAAWPPPGCPPTGRRRRAVREARAHRARRALESALRDRAGRAGPADGRAAVAARRGGPGRARPARRRSPDVPATAEPVTLGYVP